jgi:hypothetical protein
VGGCERRQSWQANATKERKPASGNVATRRKRKPSARRYRCADTPVNAPGRIVAHTADCGITGIRRDGRSE